MFSSIFIFPSIVSSISPECGGVVHGVDFVCPSSGIALDSCDVELVAVATVDACEYELCFTYFALFFHGFSPILFSPSSLPLQSLSTIPPRHAHAHQAALRAKQGYRAAHRGRSTPSPLSRITRFTGATSRMQPTRFSHRLLHASPGTLQKCRRRQRRRRRRRLRASRTVLSTAACRQTTTTLGATHRCLYCSVQRWWRVRSPPQNSCSRWRGPCPP